MRLLCLVIFFHFNDGKRRVTDTIGVELTGIAAARKHAMAQIREMKNILLKRQIQNWSELQMVVVNADGKMVFEVGFDLIPKPLT